MSSRWPFNLCPPRMADAGARSRSPVPVDAKEVVVIGLGGKTWKILLGAREPVAKLRQKVAEVSGIPLQEVVLSCSMARLSDEQLLLAGGGMPEEVQLVRIQAFVPKLEKLKETVRKLKLDATGHELKGAEWIKVNFHDWVLFKGEAMPEDNDWEDQEILFSTGDPSFTLTRYSLSETPDAHTILAKAYIKFSDDDDDDGSELKQITEIADFQDTFAELENATDEIMKEFYPPDTGKEGCKTYSLVETGNTALSVAVSPEWIYIYDSNWG